MVREISVCQTIEKCDSIVGAIYDCYESNLRGISNRNIRR